MWPYERHSENARYQIFQCCLNPFIYLLRSEKMQVCAGQLQDFNRFSL